MIDAMEITMKELVYLMKELPEDTVLTVTVDPNLQNALDAVHGDETAEPVRKEQTDAGS